VKEVEEKKEEEKSFSPHAVIASTATGHGVITNSPCIC
jgi:hypothetical protein